MLKIVGLVGIENFILNLAVSPLKLPSFWHNCFFLGIFPIKIINIVSRFFFIFRICILIKNFRRQGNQCHSANIFFPISKKEIDN